MGRAEKDRLVRTLNSHLNTIHETLQLLNQTPSSSLDKVSWDEVVKLGDQVSKQATIVGMLWTGGKPEAKGIEENMETYFNILQGFLLLSHGSTVGAGPTLTSCIHASVKQVVDSSFKLMMETVPSYGSQNKNLNVPIPQLVGAVWEACSALKKAPASNIIAIGRAMTQVAVSVKDVLREMNELKPASSDVSKEPSSDTSPNEESNSPGDCNSSDGDDDDIGDDLSPEEMKTAQSAYLVVSETVNVIKELIRTITGLVKQEKPNDTGEFVDSLEKLLRMCQDIGAQIDELGACIYPPQEFANIKTALQNIHRILDEVVAVVGSFRSGSEPFSLVCNGLRSSIRQMESEMDRSCSTDIESKSQNVVLCN